MEENIEKTIARVLISTRRKNRQYSIYDIAQDLLRLKKEYGTLGEVSKVIGITPSMISQFLSIFNLPPALLDFVKNGKIQSVSLAFYLSKLNKKDALELIPLIEKNKLQSKDIRYLLPYRRQFPDEDIFAQLQAIDKSKNIKISVIKIPKDDLNISLAELQNYISEIVKTENFMGLVENEETIDLKINKDGEALLRSFAKSKGITLNQLMKRILK